MLRGTAVLMVLAALGVAGIAALRSSAGTGPALIRITSKQTKYVRQDFGRSGTSAGDSEFIRSLLYNKKITPKAIGHSDMICTFMFGNSRNCRGTFFLPKGKIMLAGSIGNREIYELAIVGGTGLYDNARGTFTATRISRSPRREFLIFRLAG